MKIKATRHHGHPAIEVDGAMYCGDSWCDGSCGLPALTITYEDPDTGTREAKAHGAMVACGPVWQSFRVKWEGHKQPFKTSEPIEQLLKMMWW
jgi:hypothetical protein